MNRSIEEEELEVILSTLAKKLEKLDKLDELEGMKKLLSAHDLQIKALSQVIDASNTHVDSDASIDKLEKKIEKVIDSLDDFKTMFHRHEVELNYLRDSRLFSNLSLSGSSRTPTNTGVNETEKEWGIMRIFRE